VAGPAPAAPSIGALHGSLYEERRTRGLRAELVLIRDDAHASEVEAVGVPACLNGHVCLEVSITVSAARLFKERHLSIARGEELAAQLCGEGGAAVSVFRIPEVIEAASVVEPGEELDDERVCTCAP